MKFAALVLALTVLGCGDSPTVPTNVLTGQWGGQGLALTIDAQSVLVVGPCAGSYSGRGPIIPYQGTRFIVSVARDNDGQSGPNNQSTSAHAVSGVINGDQLTIDFTSITIGGNSTRSYTLVRNAPRGFSTVCDL